MEDENEIARTKKGATKKYRYRYECSADGCTNNVVNGGVCRKHGAKTKPKLCSSEGCTNVVVQGGVCWRHGAKHGAKTKRCSSVGCTNIVVNGGVCIRHGAKVKKKQRRVDGCNNHFQNGGVCMKHGAKVKVKNAALMDAQIMLSKEEFAGAMAMVQEERMK